MLLWQLNLGGQRVSARVSWVQFDAGALPRHARVSWVSFNTWASIGPPAFLYPVAAERRLFSVDLESRIFVPAAERRLFDVADESRTQTVRATQ
jgi:hypothetical protein